MDGYWDRQPPAHVKAGILADWADALQDWLPEQILYALRKWRSEFPSKKPNPGHIIGILKQLRGRAEAQRQPKATPAEPERVRVSAERAQAMSDEVASTMRKFGAKDAN